jgi:hypothetical protein
MLSAAKHRYRTVVMLFNGAVAMLRQAQHDRRFLNKLYIA